MRILILLFFIFSAQLCFPQRFIGADANLPVTTTEKVILDKSEFQCVYQHREYDPQLEKEKVHYEILQVGKDYSKYEDYPAYQLDSIIGTMDVEKMNVYQYFEIAKKYRHKTDYLIKNFEEGMLTVYGRVMIDDFIYEEAIPPIQWTLEKGTDEVCGYVCNKAVADFRGRKWTAWYSDIPLDNGPWKFGNLPGLILKLEDSKGEHKYEAVGFKNDKIEFGFKKNNFLKTTREAYNASLEEYKNNSWKFIEGTELQPKSSDGSPIKYPRRKMLYNPLELE